MKETITNKKEKEKNENGWQETKEIWETNEEKNWKPNTKKLNKIKSKETISNRSNKWEIRKTNQKTKNRN